MKKATIYFKGKPITTVSFEKIQKTDDNTYLTKGYGDSMVTVAIVPLSHLIIFE
jgi:hypothetical protein